MKLFQKTSVSSLRCSPLWLATTLFVIVIMLLCFPIPSSQHVWKRSSIVDNDLALVLHQAYEPLTSRVCGQPAVDG
jgi:hypothetical protein